MDLSMGKILDADFDTLLFGEKEGILGILSRDDVEGLSSYLHIPLKELQEKIREKGRCAVCSELREAMIKNSLSKSSRSIL
jgi:hypothetical protein